MLEDFRSTIAAVGNDSLSDRSKGVEAQAHKVMSKTVNWSWYGESCTSQVQRQMSKSFARIPTHTQAHALKATGLVDSNITTAGKKYCVLYHLWVPKNLFPICLQMSDINPLSPLHWSTAESQAAGNQAELYVMMPEELCKQMTIHSQFKSVSNALKVFKDSVAILFVPLKLDPMVFAGPKAQVEKHEDFLVLLRKADKDEYTPLTPILFPDPHAMVSRDLFNNLVLVNITHIMMYGKVSSQRRDNLAQRAEVNRLAWFLLSHNPELTPEGGETGVFSKKAAAPSSSVPASVQDVPNLWEDNILVQLGNTPGDLHSAEPEPQTTTTNITTTHTIDAIIPASISNSLLMLGAVVEVPVVSSSCTMSSVTMTPRAPMAISFTSELHVEVSNLSLSPRAKPSVSTQNGKAPAAGK
ncbi:hypothetical protein PAXRUDRAFT_27888 [Paxillus rubicundulus Ve08.2h10]|uniref:Uncharacterized protein n=1 Tax=Paxillus rubicundulus Ve08.2h10 TaxID=930991 RepID=A0A0D0D0B8_9AGAM|nr:hypothetical protein PAXRUDRAFT_27888 [Paxillus rubicundulus Ve08.2h10]